MLRSRTRLVRSCASRTVAGTLFAGSRHLVLTALLDRLIHRRHILGTASDSFRFKASSAAATRKKKEVTHALTQA